MVWFLFALVGVPYLVFFRRGEARERLGGARGAPRPGCLWVHAASLGEYEAARPIVESWSAGGDAGRLLVSCTNRSARQRLAERLPGGARTRLAPLDLLPCIRRALELERPACIVFVETEIWPEWIAEATRRGIPVAFVSARISDRTLPRYRRFRALLRPLLMRLQVIGCRSEEDRRRWIEIGAPEDRCLAWGNTKHEAGPRRPTPLSSETGERFVLVAGSMRSGEESILDLVEAVGAERLRLVVAPRHLARLVRWERACLRRGVAFRCTSTCGLDPVREPGRTGRVLRSGDAGLPPVLLVDAMGLLCPFYRCADAAFVGGTWVPIGGHNLFEPAREGIGVFFGGSIAEVRDVAASLLETGGGLQVESVRALVKGVERLLEDPPARAGMGEAARESADQLAGAAARTLAGLRERGIPPGSGS